MLKNSNNKQEFDWNERCPTAFGRAKKIMASDNVLVHYNPELSGTVNCDASAYGVARVLPHVYEDGTDQLICYALRILNFSGKNYSMLDKKALAIVYSIKKFFSIFGYIHNSEKYYLKNFEPS